jgi:hypothetical protein
MAEVSKLRIDRQITDALRQRNGPQTDRIHELPINSRVWVWRENRGWTGPYILLSTEGETCNVQLNKRLKWQTENKERDLRFIHIRLESAKLFIFVDASFANNKDYSSQIGSVIVLANEENGGKETFKFNGNIIHWAQGFPGGRIVNVDVAPFGAVYHCGRKGKLCPGD